MTSSATKRRRHNDVTRGVDNLVSVESLADTGWMAPDIFQSPFSSDVTSGYGSPGYGTGRSMFPSISAKSNISFTTRSHDVFPCPRSRLDVLPVITKMAVCHGGLQTNDSQSNPVFLHVEDTMRREKTQAFPEVLKDKNSKSDSGVDKQKKALSNFSGDNLRADLSRKDKRRYHNVKVSQYSSDNGMTSLRDVNNQLRHRKLHNDFDKIPQSRLRGSLKRADTKLLITQVDWLLNPDQQKKPRPKYEDSGSTDWGRTDIAAPDLTDLISMVSGLEEEIRDLDLNKEKVPPLFFTIEDSLKIQPRERVTYDSKQKCQRWLDKHFRPKYFNVLKYD